MSYRLVNSNEIAIKYPEVNEMDCIYVDLPNGLDNEYHRIDAEPVKHGWWEVVYYDNVPTLAYCNRCDQVLQITRETEKMPNYCPNCGARMVHEVKE